jgi:23S rRNA (uracil1939-C5)-methyltransferase
VAPRLLYDLYGGAGGIAFACADRVERIESVESWAPASADGEHNARLNDIDNVHFTAEPVEKYLGRMKLAGEPFPDDSAVVLDPPRAGLHPKAVERLALLGPRHVLYVSCNPKIFARELTALRQAYDVTAVEGVDLFPHTPHVELIAALERRS